MSELDQLVATLKRRLKIHGMTYRELWSYWESLDDAALTRHVSFLRDRYDTVVRGAGVN